MANGFALFFGREVPVGLVLGLGHKLHPLSGVVTAPYRLNFDDEFNVGQVLVQRLIALDCECDLLMLGVGWPLVLLADFVCAVVDLHFVGFELG